MFAEKIQNAAKKSELFMATNIVWLVSKHTRFGLIKLPGEQTGLEIDCSHGWGIPRLKILEDIPIYTLPALSSS